MPYSNPTSPAASSTASFVLPPPPPSTRRAHSSAEAPEGSSTRRSYHSHSSTPYWQSTLPRATLPRRATSSSPGSVKAVVGGSGPGAGEVVSPPAPPGLILPRRTSHKAAAPKEQQQPQQQSDGTSDGGLGLSITTTPSGSTVDLQSPRSPPLADQPARRPSPSRPHSSPTASNLHSRRANSSNPTSLRVDIPAHHHHAPAHAVSRSSSEHGRHGETLGGGSSAHSGGSDRPAPAMVRKKSGEVVKSSLKRRSTSTPSSAGPETGPEESSGGYWERARSEPPTPHSESTPTTPGTAERRQLRFAGDSDDDGAGDSHGQLAKVVLFKREHKVTAVTRALAGEALDQIGTGTDTETETDSWWPGGSGRGGSSGGSRGLHHNGGANANRAREKVEMDWSHSTKIPRIPGLNLTVGSSRPLSVPEYDSVVLESVSLVDEGSGANATLNLRGSLVVRNLSFVKRVAVRFTLDNWQTISEVAASHVVHISAASLGRADPAGKGWDRFAFTVKLEDHRRKIEESTLLLAIRYTLDGSGEELWDSLGGQNYHFRFNKTKPPSPPARNGHGGKGHATTATSSAGSSYEGGSAFLPLLESKGVPTTPHSAMPPPLPAGARPAPPPSTHGPLVFSKPEPTEPAVSAAWSFPSAARRALVDDSSSASSTALSSATPSPVRPTFSALVPTNRIETPSTTTGQESPAPNSVPPVSTRPTHARKKTWDAADAFSPVKPADSPLKPEPSSATVASPPLPQVIVQPIPIPATSATKVATMTSGLPSPPSSASHSPGSVTASPLPSTPNSLPTETPQPFGLPITGGGGPLQPKPRAQPPPVRDFKLPSDSYADFIDKYCFFRSETSPPLNPQSPPTSLSSGMVTPQQTSGTSSPFSLDMAAAFPSLQTTPPTAWTPKAFETIATPTFSTPSPPTAFVTPSAEAFWGGRADSTSRTATPTPVSKPDPRPVAAV